MRDRCVGIWFIGAKGGVASTAILGLLALKRNLIGSEGLTSCLPQFAHLGLLDWDRFVVAGHEIRRVPLADEAARAAAASRIPTNSLLESCGDELRQIDSRIRPGTIENVGPTIAALADVSLPRDETPRQVIDRLSRDMGDFVRDERLDDLVVVNVASTEPPGDAAGLPSSWNELDRLLDGDFPNFRGNHGKPAVAVGSGSNDRGEPPSLLPASSLYAIAALRSGYAYLNFTPSLGPALSAIDELARLQRARYYGCDGKTGETLMKSVLAPMFARRNLRVMSWVGHNIFGNMDGQVLNDPDNKRTKVASKDHLVGEILGYRPQTVVSIEYVPDLGDWKTAWDHVHFAGFLGVPMTLQFTWQGCDSVLAAPLVLDLVRFTELAGRRGHVGQMPFLASFFKSPYGIEEHRFDRQFAMLEQWAADVASSAHVTDNE